MTTRAFVFLLLACLCTAACDCSERGATSRGVHPAAQPGPLTGEGALPELPAPQGTPLAADDLAPLAPSVLAGFTASGPAERRSTPLPNGGELTAVRRAYTRDDTKLQLELTDSLHAPAVRKLITSQQGQVRKAARVDFRGMAVEGHPAIVQFQEKTRTATVSLVVGDRLTVNLRVSPASSAEPALEAARALPFAELARLAGGLSTVASDGSAREPAPAAAHDRTAADLPGTTAAPD